MSDPAEHEEQGDAGGERAFDEEAARAWFLFNAAGGGEADHDIAYHFALEARPIGDGFKAGERFIARLTFELDLGGAEERQLIFAVFAAVEVAADLPAIEDRQIRSGEEREDFR